MQDRWYIASCRRGRVDRHGRRRACQCTHRQERSACARRIAASVDVRTARRLGGRERRRAVVPRPRDAPDCWRPGSSRRCGLGQRDGTVRDGMACASGEPRRACQSVGAVDRPRAPAASVEARLGRDFLPAARGHTICPSWPFGGVGPWGKTRLWSGSHESIRRRYLVGRFGVPAASERIYLTSRSYRHRSSSSTR